MSHTYGELHNMTVAQLREVAAGIEHEAVQGYTQMNREHLLPVLCTALGIDAHLHHDVVGVNRAAIKAEMRALKKQRDAALASRDAVELKRVRRKRHMLKRKIRRAMV